MYNPSIQIFTSQDLNGFLQNHPEKANNLERFLLEDDPSALITNLKTQGIVIVQGKSSIFATLNHKEYGNTHICSPYNVYIGYAKESVSRFENKWVRALIHGFTSIFGKTFKWLQFNKVIQLNNTLSTTNLYDGDVSASYADIIDVLTKQYPKHAILWSRINPVTDASLCESLKAHRFHFIPTKMVHIFDPSREYMKIKSTKRDFSVLKQSDYTVVNHEELSESDIERIQQLYQMLFIEKHSSFNPKFTVKYFKYCHRFKWFVFTALRNKEGVIDAFCSQSKKKDVMTCGPSGYDTEKSSKLGLYRMIIWLNLNKAWEEKCLYNMGSGNEQYKLNRGSIRQMEYNAVYYWHLPIYRRIPWLILSWTGNQLSTRIFKKYLL